MKTVYCVQSTINSGHHNTYANLYCEILLDMGYSVVLLTPQPRQDISAELYIGSEKGLFFAVSMPEIDPSVKVYAEPTEYSAPARWKSLLKNMLAPVLPVYYKIKYRVRFAKDFLADKITGYRPQNGPAWPTAEHFAVTTYKTGLRPDFVFFLYIDDYLKNRSPLLQNLNVPWSGILFYTTLLTEFSYPLYSALSNKLCHGLCMLDARAIKAFRSKFCFKHFLNLPDIGFYSLPTTCPPLCEQILTRSRGRHIVLLAGALAKRKGILTLLDVALQYQQSLFFFVFCGKIHWQDFSTEEKERIEFSIASPSPNIYWHPSYLQDERELNALCSLSDIIYAVYEGSDMSSGMLSKAAYFNKPIIVTKDSLMSQEVLAGPMGEVANPSNTCDIFAALQRVASNSTTYSYSSYIQKNSRDNLVDALRRHLP